MRIKPKEFRKNNYFVLYKYDYKYDLNYEDEIICYLENWEELHNKYLKKYRPNDLVREFNKYDTNIITVFIDEKKYKLATFSDEEVDDLFE